MREPPRSAYWLAWKRAGQIFSKVMNFKMTKSIGLKRNSGKGKKGSAVGAVAATVTAAAAATTDNIVDSPDSEDEDEEEEEEEEPERKKALRSSIPEPGGDCCGRARGCSGNGTR